MKKVTLMVPAAMILATVAFAQGGPSPRGAFGAGGPAGRFGPAHGIHGGAVVTGAPYSATFTEQSVRTLASGTTITHSITGTIARDISGRTYLQQTTTGGPLGQNGPKTVTFITDPVAGFSYTINTETNVATQRPFKAPPAGSTPPAPGSQSGHTNPNVTVSKVTNADGTVTTTITRKIPANTAGNSADLVSTSTVQFNPTLKIVVSSSRNDPEFGSSTYTVSSLVPGEPNPNLFSVSGYTIQAAPSRGSRGPGTGTWTHQ